jgi:hypothetical protein
MAASPKAKSFFILWVVANSVGWVMGVIAVILLASLQEVIHFGNGVYIGVGMGFTVGPVLPDRGHRTESRLV